MTNNHSAFTTISTSDLDSVVGGKQTDGGSCPAPPLGGVVGGALSYPPGALPPDALGQSSKPRPPAGPLDQQKPTPIPHAGRPQ
jgi:hypothetical protein